MIHAEHRSCPRRRAAALALAALLCVGVSCGRKKKELQAGPVMPAPQLYEEAVRQLSQRNLGRAKKLLEQIDLQASPEERRRLEPLVRLSLADATFYQNSNLSYIDARQLYLNFVSLFRDHPMAPYAAFQAGMCSLEQASHPSKDQTQTVRAIDDFSVVQRDYPGSRYAIAARGKQREAEAILGEHEYRVGRFYMKRDAWDAAVGRFNKLLDRYPDFIEMDKVYYHLAEALGEQGNKVEAEIYLDKLFKDFPDSEYVEDARKLTDEYELNGALASGEN